MDPVIKGMRHMEFRAGKDCLDRDLPCAIELTRFISMN